MGQKILDISLFGACIVRSSTVGKFEIKGKKHRALFALLATAPFGRRTRGFLQDILWGVSCYDSGRQSLRAALANIKKVMGDAYAELITTNNSDVSLDLSKVNFIGQPGRGQFLEGLDVREAGFDTWLQNIRANPEQVFSLFGPCNPAPAAPMMPTITILPFQHVVRNTEFDGLGDWLAEEMCRALSRSNLLSVISHLSSRALSGRTVEISTVRSTLDVDYCVSGSVRILQNTIVVDADFIDAASGKILWTRQFAGPLNEFLLQSAEGINNIVRAVGQTIVDEAIAYVRDLQTEDLKNHRLLVAGVGLMHRSTLRSFAKSRELIEEALRRAPRSSECHSWLAKWYILSVFNGWSTDRAKDTQHAIDSTARALDLNPNNAFSLTIDGFAHSNLLRRLDIAASRYGEALRQNPNEALSWLLKGALHAFTENSAQAVDDVEHARRLSPIDPFQYYYNSLSATAYFSKGEYSKALELADRSLTINDRHLSTLRAKLTALHFLERTDEAREVAVELLRRQPNYSVAGYLRDHPAADHELGRKVAEALKAAGIP